MEQFCFDDDTFVELKEINGKFVVYVEDPEDGKFTISGFSDYKDAHMFIMLGDFIKGKDNDYFVIAGGKSNLKWEFSK